MPSSVLADAKARLRAWLARAAYPLWWSAGADRAGGGFHDALDPTGAPAPGVKRARVQARQAFCFAAAPAFGWDGPWAEAMRHGLAFLEARHRGSGGFYASVAGGGEFDLYDQAFVLLALAAAARAGDATAEPRAHALLDALPRHRLGGYRCLAGETLEANPNMHLLEAALAWIEAGGDGRWRSVAEDQARLALGRLIDPATGAVGEHFGPDGRAPARRADRRVEPGHQFEWAWLLMRWSVIARDPASLATALRLIDVGEAAGIDPALGVAIDLLDGDLRPLDPAARLWPQTERLKAALLAAELTGAPRYGVLAEAAAASLWPFLATPTPGLWRDRRLADGAFVEAPAPASSLYHLVGGIAELSRVIG